LNITDGQNCCINIPRQCATAKKLDIKKLNNEALELVDEFVYLGGLVTDDDACIKDIKGVLD